MEKELDNIVLIKSIAYSFLAFFIILLTLIVFVFLSRRKILANKLYNKELELSIQKNAINLIINAQEEERIRIARDLHDDISSKLNAISMSLHVLKQDKISPEYRAELSTTTLETCKTIAESSRRIAHNLMPPTLENTGLHLAIQELCTRINTSNQLSISYINAHEQKLFDKLQLENQIHLYRIVQELINNSIKHADATKIEITFIYSDDVMVFTYTDNGIGISQQTLSKNKGIGLNNICSRARIIQAIPNYHTHEKQGFKFTLTFNLL